jgi:hypothetical protein
LKPRHNRRPTPSPLHRNRDAALRCNRAAMIPRLVA